MSWQRREYVCGYLITRTPSFICQIGISTDLSQYSWNWDKAVIFALKRCNFMSLAPDQRTGFVHLSAGIPALRPCSWQASLARVGSPNAGLRPTSGISLLMCVDGWLCPSSSSAISHCQQFIVAYLFGFVKGFQGLENFTWFFAWPKAEFAVC